MIQEKMVRARRQYHHHNHHHQHNGSATGGARGNRHVLNNNHHFHRSNKRPAHVPSAPSNTTQFIMNDHELIEPDFDLMHNAIMEHYNRRKRRKSQHEQEQQRLGGEGCIKSEVKLAGSQSVDIEDYDERRHKIESFENDSPRQKCLSPQSVASPLKTATTTTATAIAKSPSKSPLKDADDEESNQQHQKHHHNHHNHHHHNHNQQQQQHSHKHKAQHISHQPQEQLQQNMKQTTTTQLQESTNMSQPTTPNYRPVGSPGDEDGLSPFINYEHLQSEFQEVYANVHTERLSSMSKHQLVDKYLLLEERVEELENQLRESQTAAASLG